MIKPLYYKYLGMAVPHPTIPSTVYLFYLSVNGRRVQYTPFVCCLN